MFDYDYEKRPPSSHSCDSRATVSTDWSRRGAVPDRGPRRPLPPRPVPHLMPAKTAVPLKIWIIASASCFAVCAALVLATVVITKWGGGGPYTREVYADPPEPIYYNSVHEPTDDIEKDMQVMKKLSMFKNLVANRDKAKSLLSKHQMHPVHEEIQHEERKIEKKDKAKLDKHTEFDTNNQVNEHVLDELKDNDHFDKDSQKLNKLNSKFDRDHDINKDNHEFDEDFTKFTKTDHAINKGNEFDKDTTKFNKGSQEINKDTRDKVDQLDNDIVKNLIPDFKPIDFKKLQVELPETFVKYKEVDYQDYYDDVNLYNDYIESNSLTNYLMEKVQELHDWVVKDPDFDKVMNSTRRDVSNDFGQVLKALNSSLVEGNVSIVMNTLRDLYFGERSNKTSRSVISNSTDLVSFGILSLDVMLLHNIQMMAWESQESARVKMLKDPDVFTFNALFLDPSKMEAMQNEPHAKDNTGIPKRQNKQEEEDDFGKNLLNNILDIGMSTARAAIHLGKAYKNTRTLLNQLASKEATNQITRDIDGNTQVLNRLQASFGRNESVASADGFYTELDCVWLLYCRNLVATSKLNSPYGTMARINGVALRMLSGELSADRAVDTMLYEAFTGWTDLQCDDMFPKCSKANAASVIMHKIIQPLKKHASTV